MSVAVCLSVCLHVSKTACPNFVKFSVDVTWPLLDPHLTTVQYVLSFWFLLDDLMFPHNKPRGAWLVEHILKVTYQGAERIRYCH